MTSRGGWFGKLFGGSPQARRPDAGTGTDPEDAPALAARAYALVDEGKPGRALRLVVDALEARPGDAALMAARANLLGRAGRMPEAIDAYRGARAAGAAGPEFLVRHAWALHQAGAPLQARAIVDELLAATPDDPDALFAAAMVARGCGDPALGAAHLRRASALRRDDVRLAVWLARAETAAGDPARGAALAASLVEARPQDLAARDALVYARMLLDDPHAAIDAIDRLLALADARPDPESAVLARRARVNRAVKRYELGAIDDAIAELVAVLREGPDIDAQFHLAVHSLEKGWFKEGWKRYVARWLVEPYAGRRPHPALPRWSGQAVAGMTILIGAEQGIGDVIMFGRFFPELRRRGARVLLEVPASMRRLAVGLPGIDRVVVAGEPAPVVDFFISLGGLMPALGVELDTVPRAVPYLGVEPALRAAWAHRLGDCDELKVGFVWAGSPTHVRDAFRSIPALALAPLVAVDGVRFHSLQKGPQSVELAGLKAQAEVVDLGPELVDYADTLAAIDALDLVITVDTSVAHAAGALGKPVWMMVSTPSEFRWLDGREDTVWYPTMRLFRQHRQRDWSPVIDDVRDALVDAVAQRRRGDPWHVVTQGEWRAPTRLPDLAEVPDVVEARDGVFQLPSGTDVPAVAALVTQGEYLPSFRELVVGLVPSGGAVIEVGAGFGELTLALARRLGDDGRLLALETATSRQAFLAQNLGGNRIRNTTILANRVDAPSDDASIDALVVDRLDGLILRDVGEKGDVIAGAERTLWTHRPWVAAESASLGALRAQARRLAGCGYRCWTVVLPMFEAMNYNRAERDVFDGAVRHGLLAFPEERDQALPPDRFSEVVADA